MHFSGSVPGDITITVDIPYLANKLPGGSDRIFLSLKKCSLFEYERSWSAEKSEIYSTFDNLPNLNPQVEVLSAEENGGVLEIYEVCGIIRTKYEHVALALENGQELSFSELDNASKEYWDNFGKNIST